MSNDMLEFSVIATSDKFSPFALHVIGVNEIEEWVTFVIHNELHRVKLRRCAKGMYFIYQSARVYLSECVKTTGKIYARVRGK